MNTERKADDKYTLDDLMCLMDDELTQAFDDVLEGFNTDTTGDEWSKTYDAREHIKKAMKIIEPMWQKRYRDGAEP